MALLVLVFYTLHLVDKETDLERQDLAKTPWHINDTKLFYWLYHLTQEWELASGNCFIPIVEWKNEQTRETLVLLIPCPALPILPHCPSILPATLTKQNSCFNFFFKQTKSHNETENPIDKRNIGQICPKYLSPVPESLSYLSPCVAPIRRDEHTDVSIWELRTNVA